MSAEDSVSPVIPSLPLRKTGRSSWQVFLRSLHAFLLREMKTQFGRSRIGYFWALAEPAVTVAILVALHASIPGGSKTIYGVSPIIFFVFGAAPYFMFSNALSQTQGVCASQKGLFNYRQIKPIDVMLARSLIDALMMGAVIVLFMLGWSWLGLDLDIAKPLELMVALVSLFSLGVAMGLVFEVFGTVFQDMRNIFSMLTRPLFFVSGAFFTLGSLPPTIQKVLAINPILHGVDLARDAVLSGYDSPASWLYLWFSILSLLFIGLAAYRRYLDRLI